MTVQFKLLTDDKISENVPQKHHFELDIAGAIQMHCQAFGQSLEF